MSCPSTARNNRFAAATVALRRAVAEALEDRRLLAVSMVNGWTVVTLNTAVGDRAIYVSDSLGSDTNNGLSSSSPVKTLNKGKNLIRDGTGDQLLLRRGDTWTNQNFGTWDRDGRNDNEPIVIGTYGSGARPLVRTGTSDGLVTNSGGVRDLVVQGIALNSSGRDPNLGTPTLAAQQAALAGFRFLGRHHDVRIEDVEVSYYQMGLSSQSFYDPANPATNLTIRRSVFRDSYGNGDHSSGAYIEGTHGITLEENVFDHNGWNEQIPRPSTIFNHNVYIQATSSGLVARRNLFARGASHGLQARPGGIVEDNTFLDNPIGLSYGLVNGSKSLTHGGVTGSIRRNTFLGGGVIQSEGTSGDRGIGIQLANIASATIADNVFAHYTAGTNKHPAFEITIPRNIEDGNYGVGINNLTIANNRIYKWNHGMSINGEYDPHPPKENDRYDVHNFNFRDNHFQEMAETTIISLGAFNDDTEIFANNRYDVATGTAQIRAGGVTQNLSSWISSNESGSQVTAVSYLDANRSAASYASFIGVGTTKADYLNAARALRNGNWHDNRTGKAFSDYIRAGFFGTPPGDTVPPAPTNVNATATTSTQINVTWTDVATNETGYEIDRATNSAFTSGLVSFTAGANATSYTDSGLAEWTTYYYRVRATNSAGDSPNSTTASEQTPGRPTAATGLGAAAVSSSQINLTWTDNSNWESGYEVDRATNSTFTSGLTSVTIAANSTNYSSTGLSAATTYYYRVRATNQWGDSTNSNTASATTTGTISPPAAPSGLAASSASSSQINLTWTDNATTESGFEIDVATNSAFTGATTLTAPINATSFSATELTEWTTYYFRVRATNAGGDSANSNTASAPTPGRPVAPTGLTATAASPTQVNLAWTDNSNWETAHRIERATDAGFTTGLTTFTSTQSVGSGTGTRTFSDTTAQAGKTYHYRVYAFNTHGDSASPSNTATATTASSARELTATAGAYVRNGTHSATNFGTAGTIDVKQSATVGNTREGYLRFDVSTVGSVESAKLRLFGLLNNSTDTVTVGVYDVTAGWSEASITWDTKPASAATAIATVAVTGTTGGWYELDVTAWLEQQRAAGNAAVSLALKATGITDAYASFNSDEAASNKPVLSVVGSRIVAATADAYVRDGASAATNFGSAASLDVKTSTTSGNTREAYVTFDLTDVASFTNARLRLYGLLLNGTDAVTVNVYDVTASWTESAITWNNKPASGTSVLGSTTVTRTTGAWYEIDLTSWLQQQKAAGRTSVTLALKTTAITTAYASFNSSEAALNGPELVVT